MREVLTACHNRSFFILFFALLETRALVFTYHWKSANFSDPHFLQVFQCKPKRQTRRNYDKIPWHETSWVWSIRKSNICRRFDERLLDMPNSEFLSRFELLVCNPGLKRNNELINLTIGMTGSMQQFWITVFKLWWNGPSGFMYILFGLKYFQNFPEFVDNEQKEATFKCKNDERH